MNIKPVNNPEDFRKNISDITIDIYKNLKLISDKNNKSNKKPWGFFLYDYLRSDGGQEYIICFKYDEETKEIILPVLTLIITAEAPLALNTSKLFKRTSLTIY